MAHAWSQRRRFAFAVLFAPVLLAAQDGTPWDHDFQNGVEAFAAGRHAQAVESLTAALESAQKFSPLDLRRAYTAQLLAMSYQYQGKFDTAEPLFLEAKHILETNGDEGRKRLGITLDSLGQLRFEQQRWKEAEALLGQAIDLCSETRGENDECTLEAKHHLGEVYSAANRLDEAEFLFQQVISRTRQNPDLAKILCATLREQAYIFVVRGQLKVAEPLLKEALDLNRKLGTGRADFADSLVALARLYRLENDSDRAEALLNQAASIYEKNNDPCIAQASQQLGLIALTKGKYALARQRLLRAVSILTSFLGPDHVNVAYAEAALAEAYLGERNYAAAKPLIDHALAVEGAPLNDPQYYELARAHMTAAQINQAQARGAEADAHYKQALDIYRRTTPRNNPDRVIAERQYERFSKSFRK